MPLSMAEKSAITHEMRRRYGKASKTGFVDEELRVASVQTRTEEEERA
jgi:hypothetical protein